MSGINKSIFKFLNDLSENNNRDWFAENKKQYLTEHEKVITFADELLLAMSKSDSIETPTGKKSLYRIYRDTRFSKDKTPYKKYFSGHFTRATKQLRGGYYFHLEPGNVIIAGGFWAPEKEDITRIREEIAADDTELRNIISNKTFLSNFEELKGDQLKTAPKGFPKDHKAIELLRYKQYLVVRHFTDEETFADDFHLKAIETFKAMRPFFDYMSVVLTTNANGEPLYED